jgi:hypothetical protein
MRLKHQPNGIAPTLQAHDAVHIWKVDVSAASTYSTTFVRRWRAHATGTNHVGAEPNRRRIATDVVSSDDSSLKADIEQ